MVATITFTHVFGSTPASQVSCAVMTPVGLIDVFIQGTDAELASGGDTVSFSCTVPYTSPATDATPMRAFWRPDGVETVFPPTGTVVQSPPPPIPPPPPAPVAGPDDSSEPGQFIPGDASAGQK